MKKLYEMPVAYVTTLLDEDVITTSELSFSSNEFDNIQDKYNFDLYF